MALDNRSPSSALFKRAEQLRRWQESETNRTEIYEKPRKVNFSDGCIFLAACAAGDKNEVLRLLEKGADIDTANVDGLTALHAACIDDNLDMVEFLVDQGADVNRGDMEGWTPLHATASCGFNSIAQFLIDRGADLALVNNDGDLCIDIADSEEMEGLLQSEVDNRGIDCEASRNEEERRMREDAQRWLNAGYCADRPHSKTGASALHVAAAKGYHKVMNVLLEAGADINAQDFDGWTPLHAAAHWGQREAVEILCENDCDMEVRNFVGQSAFDVADNGLIKLLEELKRKQASRRLTNRKRKTSPNRDSRSKKEKEDQRGESDGTSGDESTSDVEKKNKVNKEHVAQIIPTSTTERNNGRSPVTPNKTSDTMDDSEVQSWRRPSSLRNKTSPPDDRNQKEEVTRTISTPARISSSREEESIQRTSSSPEKDDRNHVDSMAMLRVSLPADPSSGVLNTSISPPARSVGRSFVPPSRDEESETQRKAHAKMVRSTRRSTQGVTLEEIKSAEQLMKNKKQEAFTLENVAKSKEGENEVDAVTAPLRKKSTDVGDEDKESERTSQTREGTQAVLQRRKKPKRRSTGRVQVNMDEIDPEKRAARLAEQQQKQAAGEEVSDEDEEEEDSIELGKTHYSSPRGTPDSSDHSCVSDLEHVVQEEWKGMEISMSHESSSLSKSPPTHRSPPCSPKYRSPTPPAQDWYFRRSTSPTGVSSPSRSARRHYRRSCTPPDREIPDRGSLTPPDEYHISRRSCTPTDTGIITNPSDTDSGAEMFTKVSAVEGKVTELEKDSNQSFLETKMSQSDASVCKDNSLEISKSSLISMKQNEFRANVESFQTNETKIELFNLIETSTKTVDYIDTSSSLDQINFLEISRIEANGNSIAADKKHSNELSEENSTQNEEILHESPNAQPVSEIASVVSTPVCNDDILQISIQQEVKDSSSLKDYNSKEENSVPLNSNQKVIVESQKDISISNSSVTNELDISIKEYSLPPEPPEENISSQENKITIKSENTGIKTDVESTSVKILKEEYSSENSTSTDTANNTDYSAEISISPPWDESKLMPPVFSGTTKYLTPSPERGAASVYSTPWESPATTPEREYMIPPVFSIPYRTPTTSPNRENNVMPSVYSTAFKSSTSPDKGGELMEPVYASPFMSPTTSPDRDIFEIRPIYSSIFVSPATSPDREVGSLPAVYSSVFQSPATSPDRQFNFIPAVFSAPFKSPTTTPDRDSLLALLMPPIFSTPWRTPTTSPEKDIAFMPPVFSKNYRYASPDKDDIKLVQEILMRPVYSQTWRPTLSPSPVRIVAPEVVVDSPVDDKLLCPPVFSSPFRSPTPSPERAWKSVTPSPERYFDSETNFTPITEPKKSHQPPRPVYYTAGTAWSEESTTSPERGLFLSSDQSLSERGEGTKATTSSVNSRSTTRSTSLGPENGEPDYKKLYEEQLAENSKILERLRITETDLQTARETIEANNKKNNTEKREKRALERKLSEMEEELKLLEHLKQENQKLKDENGALIRVISKLSK